MKAFFTGIFLLAVFSSTAQRLKITPLDYPEGGAFLKPNETIIYGSFLRKPGIWYDYDQMAILKNVKTKELFSILFEEHMKKGKESTFCFYIKPGTYEIVSLIYKKAKWYGDLQTTTPVFRNIDYTVNVKAKVDSGLIKVQDLSRFSFNVEGNGLYYIGKWHFETGIVSFSDDKAALDKKLPADFYFLKFNEATTVIPN